jgi:hypothetical protein
MPATVTIIILIVKNTVNLCCFKCAPCKNDDDAADDDDASADECFGIFIAQKNENISCI